MISKFSFQVEDADSTYSNITMTIEIDGHRPGITIGVDGKTYEVNAKNTENMAKILDMAVQS